MGEAKNKIFTGLGTALMCERKTELLPVDPSGVLHNHDGYEILLLLKGTAHFYGEKSSAVLQPGNLLLIQPYSFHSIASTHPLYYERIVINITGELMQEISDTTTDLSSCFSVAEANGFLPFYLSENKLSQLIPIAYALEQSLQDNSFGHATLTKSYLAQLMVLLNRFTLTKDVAPHTGIMPKIVADTFSYIEEHISEGITLHALAEHVHHNGDYLSRCFKAVTGVSLQQFIISKKLTLAQKLLREGISPGEVCYMTGFGDYSNFSRTFSNHVGQSPKQFQRSWRGN